MKKVVGYTNRWSLAPGDTLEVKVSTYGPESWRAGLVSIVCGDDNPDHAILRKRDIAAPFAGEDPDRTLHDADVRAPADACNTP